MSLIVGLLIGAAAFVVGIAARPSLPTRSLAPRVVVTTAKPSQINGRSPRRRRHDERALDRAFPDALDLFVVTVQAGYTPIETLRSVGPLVHPLIGAAFADVLARVDRGERFGDALSSVVESLGPRGSNFADTLTVTERAGLPLAPAIDRLADDARQHRRRLAEADARQLPVRLSFPLVLCTLTSFVLVAIVPLLLGALTSFDRSSP